MPPTREERVRYAEAEHDAPSARSSAVKRGISPRSLVAGLVAVTAICWLVPCAELVTRQIMIGILAIPPVAVAMLFALVALNRAARRLAPGRELHADELAVVYIMMMIATMVSSFGLMERLLPTLVGVNYLANPGNQWEQLYFPNIQPWMTPWDPGGGPSQFVTTAFYEGLREGERVPWRLWATPLGWWLSLYAMIAGALLCLASILRRQWSDNERLSFPLVQLPVEMMRQQEGRPFFADALMWIGFAVPALLFSLNGLHNLRPDMPSVPVQIRVSSLLPPPYSDMSTSFISLSPGALGLFYLLPREMLVSFWVFHLLGKAEELAMIKLAVPEIQPMHVAANGYVGYQVDGAFFMLVAFTAMMAMPHLRMVLRRAFLGRGPAGEAEMLPYRASVLGMIALTAGAIGWLWHAGAAVAFAAFSVLVYMLVQAVVMARATAEGGLPMTEGCFTPLDISSLVIPPRSLGPRTLTVFAFFDALYTRDLRGILLPTFLDGQKIADLTGLRRRNLLLVLLLSVSVAVPLSAAIQLWITYHHGALDLWDYFERGNNIQFFAENSAHLRGEHIYSSGAIGWFVLGAAFTGWLGIMRVRFAGWPFLPLGYALSQTYGVVTFWAPMLVAWVIKSLVVRYGGMRAYGRLRPMFLGMVFGEFTTAVGWAVAAMIWGVQAPWFPWT